MSARQHGNPKPDSSPPFDLKNQQKRQQESGF
jgi:hypothetical protein